MKSALEIAQEAKLRPITEIAAAAGIDPKELEGSGLYRGKKHLFLFEKYYGRSHWGCSTACRGGRTASW